MEVKTITVRVKVEGAYPPGEAQVTLPEGATLGFLLGTFKRSGHNFAGYLFNGQSGEPAVRLALVNSRSVLFARFERFVLSGGDTVYFILPVGGG